MALGFTDESHVAIIDTVTDQPLEGLSCFESLEHAADFLIWLGRKHAAGMATDTDPRKLTPRYRRGLFGRWWEERVDPVSGLLRDTEPATAELP